MLWVFHSMKTHITGRGLEIYGSICLINISAEAAGPLNFSDALTTERSDKTAGPYKHIL